MLTHLNEQGEANMVNVGEKPVTVRTACACGKIRMQPETLQALLHLQLKKGDGLAAARIAGILGGKQTANLIPLCHNIPIDKLDVRFEQEDACTLAIFADAACTYKTGIEMEALTAVSLAALTIYDMCKAMDRGMVIEDIRLLEKTGGKSDYRYEG